MPGISFCARDLVLCPGSRFMPGILPTYILFLSYFIFFKHLNTPYTLFFSFISTDCTMHSLNGSLHPILFKSAERRLPLYYFVEYLILAPMTSWADKSALHHHHF